MRCLPHKAACDILIEAYVDNVHWYTWLFDMSTWLEYYENFMGEDAHSGNERSGTAGAIQLDEAYSFAVLILAIITVGARYAMGDRESLERVQEKMLALGDLRSFDLLLKGFSKTLESNYVSIVSQGNIASVQTSMLIAIYFLHKRMPNMVWSVLGTSTKLAQSLRLH